MATKPPQLLLDDVYPHEAQRPDQIYLSPPLRDGRKQDDSWASTLNLWDTQPAEVPAGWPCIALPLAHAHGRSVIACSLLREGGFHLFSTMKLKRARIEALMAVRLAGWYAESDKVQWA